MSRRDLAFLLGGLFGLTLIGYLAGVLVTRVFDGFFVSGVDRPAIDWLADHRTGSLNSFMKGATTLGAGAVITGITLAAGVSVYFLTRDVRWSAFLIFAGLGGVWLDKILKPLVGRDRPDFDRLIEIGGYSFPSGHATAVTGLWLALALFAHVRWGRKAIWMWIVSGSVIVVVLLTRPYLGVHYPTDVVAGAILSAGWVVLCLRCTRAGRPEGKQE